MLADLPWRRRNKNDLAPRLATLRTQDGRHLGYIERVTATQHDWIYRIQDARNERQYCNLDPLAATCILHEMMPKGGFRGMRVT